MIIKLQSRYFFGIGVYAVTIGLVKCLTYLVNVAWNSVFEPSTLGIA